MNEQHQFDALDIVSVLSLCLGWENLIENRAQSAHNDVSAANDKQARFLLEEIGRNFEEMKSMLLEILEVLKREKSDREKQRNSLR